MDQRRGYPPETLPPVPRSLAAFHRLDHFRPYPPRYAPRHPRSSYGGREPVSIEWGNDGCAP